jgi:hypothetical protein
VSAYNEAQANVSDNASALSQLQTMQKALQDLNDLCANVAVPGKPGEESIGSGTIADPYAFGVAGDTGEGASLRVVGYIRPADNLIRNANMFNDRPGEGEEYIILTVELVCNNDNPDRCESNYLDFELTGNSGTIYSHPFVVYDNEFDVGVFAGGSGQGDLVFLIRQNDTNLKLLYRANMFSNDVVAYEAEPSLSTGVQITATSNVNVRNGPSTNAAVVGNLPASQAVIAFGRNSNGTWLQIPNGWVFAELVTAAGDIQTLPVTSQ